MVSSRATAHPVAWQTPAPLWSVALADTLGRTRFQQPALLRFATDSFMENVSAVLAGAPAQLKDYVARYETWDTPAVGWLEESASAQANLPRLYQAVHGRHYLVAASLVCRVAGLPDRAVMAANEEKVSFVLRRLVARGGGSINPRLPGTYDEYAWTTSTTGASQWTKVPGDAGDPSPVVADVRTSDGSVVEERLPMFGLTYQDGSQPRRVWLGLLPVASRQVGVAKAGVSSIVTEAAEAGTDPLAEPRTARLSAGILAPLAILRRTLSSGSTIPDSDAAMSLAFNLADFAQLLNTYVPGVLGSGTAGPAGAPKPLFDRLEAAVFKATLSWWDALNAVQPHADKILAGQNVAGLPTEGLTKGQIVSAIDALEGMAPDENNPLPRLRAEFAAALAGSAVSSSAALAAILPESPKIDPGADSFFVVRCVYDRPRCGRLHPPVVSLASAPFQLATFFDPKAPARPLRIALPVDTSPAGLRKFPRNVAFLISDQLRKQMNRVQGVKMQDLDSGKLDGDGGVSLGMICSFSIPIITICALILLLIIVFLLNIVFWWLPFFRICLPLRLKA